MEIADLQVPSSGDFRLAQVDPDETFGITKETAQAELPDLVDRLNKLQTLMYAERAHALLLVFQALDAGGKDGTIRRLLTGVNPQGVRVASFKQPSADELAHDFLWRVHPHVPAKGLIGVFNRSHYEDVLVARVHSLVPKKVWRARYGHINRFEQLLADTGTVILKFYLHISRAEQKERLEERLTNPNKQWKFSVADLKERERWDDYRAAFEEMLNQTSQPWAPWHVIPANHKWPRSVLVARIVVAALEGLGMRFPEPAEPLDGVVIP